MDHDETWRTQAWLERAGWILDSFERWLKRPLLDRAEDRFEDARRLYHAPFVVVSHDTQADPHFQYGNLKALELWELTVDQLLAMPSRLSAEPMHREERARLLQKTSDQGYADDYQGIRISRTGKRFRIEDAIIWNLVDEADTRQGQAATFSRWTNLS